MAGNGAYDWIGPRVRSEKALSRGIKKDARQTSVGPGGRKSANTARKVRRTIAGNQGSFKRQPG